MAVSATELKPRGALSLFDAAVRVVMLNSGTWALTLPSGALLLGAGLQLADSVTKRHSLWWPVLAWSLAWALRAVSQGATCHYVERLVVGTEPASVGASLRAAFARAPSLVTASAMMLVTSVLVWGLSAGLGFLAFGAHAVAYAVTMQGQGRPSKLFSTSRQLLGPTRFAASWVRVCGVVQVVLALNLHLTVILGLKLATSLLGFDLTYVGRFAELSNPVWVLTLIIVTFTLFEPIRAATASLLLVDGRVRQEGLDLVASVEQLPRKKKRVPTSVATALAAAVAFASLWPEQGWATTARASTTKAKSTTAPPGPPPTPAAAPEPLATEQSNVRLRLVRLRRACGSPALDQRTLTALRALSPAQQNALARFVSRLERRAYDDEDCEGAEAEFDAGQSQLLAARQLEEEDAAQRTHDDAQAILNRPEFRQTPPPPPDADDAEPAPDQDESWWSTWWRRFLKWLAELLKSQTPVEAPERSRGNEMIAANVVMVGVVAVIAVVLVLLFLKFRRPPAPAEELALATMPLDGAAASDPMSALSRPVETWASQADALAARGEFRDAIRHLYLALLARFHAEGRISYEPTRSNWEYLRDLKNSNEARPFRELTRRFDFAWYGHLFTDADAYQVFRQLTAPLLASPQPNPEASLHA